MKVIRWLFTPPREPVTVLRVVAWWELRRIPFNIIIGAFGIVCLIIFFVSIDSTGTLQPGEEAVEPLALFTAPFAVNAFYTAGWIVDVPLRWVRPSTSAEFTPRLFRLGLGFSFFMISIPAVFWGGYRVLQLIHVLR